jgi:hypothetical protein
LQEGKAQPRSRGVSASRSAAVARRCWRPTSKGIESLPSTIGIRYASQAKRRASLAVRHPPVFSRAVPRPSMRSLSPMVRTRCGRCPPRVGGCVAVGIKVGEQPITDAGQGGGAELVGGGGQGLLGLGHGRDAGCVEGGVRRIVAVITRTWLGPIALAASSVAVAGSVGGSVSPVSDRRGANSPACSARALASALDRWSTPAASRAVRLFRRPIRRPRQGPGHRTAGKSDSASRGTCNNPSMRAWLRSSSTVITTGFSRSPLTIQAS